MFIKVTQGDKEIDNKVLCVNTYTMTVDKIEWQEKIKKRRIMGENVNMSMHNDDITVDIVLFDTDKWGSFDANQWLRVNDANRCDVISITFAACKTGKPYIKDSKVIKDA